MKVWVRCCKCGEAFEAEEGVHTDVCPHCMFFVDIAKLRDSCEGNNPGAAENAEKRGVSAIHVPPRGKPTDEIKKWRETEMYESLLRRAQAHCERKEWGKAATCYEECLYRRKDWRAHFGIVFARTRGFTDFSKFTFVEYDSAKKLISHVRTAFSGINEENKKKYAARYLPLLEKRRAELCGGLAALDRAVPRAHEGLRQLNSEAGETKREKQRSKRKIVVPMCLFLTFFLLSVVGTVISFLAEAYVFATVAMFFTAFFAAGLFISAVSFQKLKGLGKIDETLRFSFESTIRDKKLIEEVSERTSEQIAAIDLISGYLKF